MTEPATAGDRLILVATSPRLPAGLLSWQGWEALRSGPVYATEPDSPQARAVRAAGVEVSALPTAAGSAQPDVVAVAGLSGSGQVALGSDQSGDRARAAAFRDLARGGRIAVWLAGPDGEPVFAQALGDLVAREGGAELEVVFGSWDPPGARLLDVVSTMDRLRSPGGCPWDAQQTHESLMPYLLEEAYEAYQALEDHDLTALREELGDVLLQVVFHARLAQEESAPVEDGSTLPVGDESPSGVDQPAFTGGGWSIDDVAGDLVDKLVRRHPHVFAGVAVSGADEVHANWQEIKRAEKRRTSVTEGVPLALPALLLAATLQRKAAQVGLPDQLEPLEAAEPAEPAEPADRPTRTDDAAAREFGYQLFELVRAARTADVDPEAALRAVCRRYRDLVVAAERQRATSASTDTGGANADDQA